MNFRTWRYLFKLGWKNLWYHKVYTAASALTMSACIFLFGLLFLAVLNVDSVLQRTEEDVYVAVFFDEDVAPERIDEVGNLIRNRAEVLRTVYTTADEAWDEFRADFFEETELMEGIFEDDNPLSASSHFQVYIKGIEQQESFVAYASSLEGVRKVTHSADTVRALVKMKDVISRVAMGSAGLLVLLSVLLIHNTLSVVIEAQKDKMHVMRLMGAREEFIKVPFCVQAFVMALLGLCVPLLLLFGCYRWGVGLVSSGLRLADGGVTLLPWEAVFPQLIVACGLLGVVTGVVGALSVLGKLKKR